MPRQYTLSASLFDMAFSESAIDNIAAVPSDPVNPKALIEEGRRDPEPEGTEAADPGSSQLPDARPWVGILICDAVT